MEYLSRLIEVGVKKALMGFPVVALLGPRQCGKSTLARHIISNSEECIFLDLESPKDLLKFDDPEFFLTLHKDKLICIDEVQRKPDLFPILRVLVDKGRRPGRFLLLGSASQELIKQSSESLAGRISYHELTPFLEPEVNKTLDFKQLWIQGGFPDSALSQDPEFSMMWRREFIKTFLERDLSELGFNLSSIKMQRFWLMMSHYHGQVANYSKLGNSLDVRYKTIKNWMEIFEATFMLRLLPPLEANLKKRLVKAPKCYLRDSGILHSLQDVESLDDLLGHPNAGSSWEGFSIETIINQFPLHKASYYRTSNGEEIDLILERKNERIGFEFKLSSSPKLSRGVNNSINDLKLKHLFVVIPLNESFSLKPKITVCGLKGIYERVMSL